MNCHGECNKCVSGWLCGRGPKTKETDYKLKNCPFCGG